MRVGAPLADAPGVESPVTGRLFMGISALGAGPSPFGENYNVTSATNSQFLQEVQSLGQQGKLTTNQQVLLAVSAVGGVSVPVNNPHETVAQALSDPMQRNFLAEYQNIDYHLHLRLVRRGLSRSMRYCRRCKPIKAIRSGVHPHPLRKRRDARRGEDHECS
jgi:hypothetical protein